MARESLRGDIRYRDLGSNAINQGEAIKTSSNVRLIQAALGAAALAGAYLAPATQSFAGDSTEAKLTQPIPVEEPLGSKITGLLNFDFGTNYITPRGLNVQNKGLTIQPLALLFFDLYSSKDGPLTDATFTAGVWNDFQTYTRNSGPRPGPWDEIDFTGGITLKGLKGFQFDTFYTSFTSQTGAYPTTTNLDFKLTYHDSFIPGFGINPYVEYFQDVTHVATVALDPATSRRSFYFVLGMDPTYAFKCIPLTIELPTFMNFCGSHFYQKFDGEGGGSGFALISTELKGTVPLKFIPKGYGLWSVYAGVQYYNLQNDGLLDGNQVLATSTRARNLVQGHLGLTIFF